MRNRKSSIKAEDLTKGQGRNQDSHFFPTWDTMEAGGWRSDLVNGLLQIAASARANPQFGLGGAEKVFIPTAEHAKSLLPVGDLIPLADANLQAGAIPSGAIAEIIDLELSLRNSLVAARGARKYARRNRSHG